MTSNPTPDPESARALLWRHGLPEDVIDGALCLHAQELAAVQRREAAVWGVDTAAGKRILGAADLIDPASAAAPASSSVVGQATRDRIAEALSDTDRQFLTFALDLAADQMASRGSEFDADDEAAMQRLRRLADEAQQPEVVPCMRSEAHPPHLHSGLRKGVAVHGRCPGGSDVPARQTETPAGTDAALARVERLALTFEVSGNEFIAQQIRAAVGAPRSDTQTHVYLSTGCLHGQHEYCQNTEGVAGPKKPAQCKFCTTRCVCGCHAVGARQPDTQTQAHPPQHAWRVETRDPLADQWAPGSHFAHRPAALERWETANRNAPLWRDGTPVERRIVRETTTYTVEVEHQPASSAVPGRSAATDTHEETDRIVAYVLAANTDLHCLRCAPSPRGDIWTPVTADELDDGGQCAKCGVDVLIRPETVHGCPPDGSGLTPCCERTPFELPRTDRISSEAPITCPGKEA